MVKSLCTLGVLLLTAATVGFLVYVVSRSRRTEPSALCLVGPQDGTLVRSVEELMLSGRLEPLRVR